MQKNDYFIQRFHNMTSVRMSVGLQRKHPTPMAIVLNPSIYWGFIKYGVSVSKGEIILVTLNPYINR